MAPTKTDVDKDWDKKAAGVEKILNTVLDVLETEYGMWGLDHALQLVESRRKTWIQDLSRAINR
jgi:hypothetical protein